MSTSKQALELQMRVVLRMSNVEGRLDGTIASTAAIYFHAASKNAERALGMLPDRTGPFWGTVADYLAKVVIEEQSERGPLLGKTGTGG